MKTLWPINPLDHQSSWYTGLNFSTTMLNLQISFLFILILILSVCCEYVSPPSPKIYFMSLSQIKSLHCRWWSCIVLYFICFSFINLYINQAVSFLVCFTLVISRLFIADYTMVCGCSVLISLPFSLVEVCLIGKSYHIFLFLYAHIATEYQIAVPLLLCPV